MAEWDEIIAFWFPEDADVHVDPARHLELWTWRMQGGADGAISSRYVSTTELAIEGAYDHWAHRPLGRLALIIVLDQFPRSIWRDTPRAYAQDRRALDLAMEGYENGHYARLPHPWHKTVYNLPLGHCEGEGHLERLDLACDLARAIQDEAPEHLRPGYGFPLGQAAAVRAVIARFGRHPHRNGALGRPSTPEEAAYIAQGQFPHLRRPPAR